jgi:L-asparaginase II
MHAPVPVEVTRGGIPESRHDCAVAAWEAGSPVLSLGDTARPVWMRSSAKPFQALGFVLSGAADRFGATEEELAVACASHGAEDYHLGLVRSLLARGGLEPRVLGCGAHPPACTAASVALARSGGRPETVHNNCSGKHAAMVLTALHLGAPVEDYLRPDHPVQVANRRNLALFAGVDAETILLAVDGCSAPNFAIPLMAQAAAFARLAVPDESVPPTAAAAARRIVAAMTRFPRAVAWTAEGDAALMGAAPGKVVSKLGAEGLQCLAATGRGLGLAVKAEDGASRPRLPLVVALLRAAGVFSAEEAARVGPAADLVVRNHRGFDVGRIVVRLPDAVRALARPVASPA